MAASYLYIIATVTCFGILAAVLQSSQDVKGVTRHPIYIWCNEQQLRLVSLVTSEGGNRFDTTRVIYRRQSRQPSTSRPCCGLVFHSTPSKPHSTDTTPAVSQILLKHSARPQIHKDPRPASTVANMGAWQSSFQSPWKDTVVRTNSSETFSNTAPTCISTNIMPCVFPPPFTRDFPSQHHSSTFITISTNQAPTNSNIETARQSQQPTSTSVSDEVAKLLPRDDWRWRHFCKAGKPTKNMKNDGTQRAQGAVMDKNWYC